MKKLTRNFFYFFLTCVPFCLLFYLINQQLFKTVKPEFAPDIEYVSVGASLTEFGLSDSIIPNFLNCSLSGRSSLSVMKTAEAVLSNNPQVKGIVVEFGIQAMMGIRDLSFLIPNSASNEFLSHYPLISYKDVRRYPIHYKYYLLSLIRKEWVLNMDYMENYIRMKRDLPVDNTLFPYLGSYKPRDIVRTKIDTARFNQRVKMLQVFTGKELPMSNVDVSYIDSLVNLTKKYDRELIVFEAPMQAEFVEMIPDVYVSKFEEYKERAVDQDHVRYYSFLDFDLPDSCIINYTHLNIYGSRIISEAFRDSLYQTEY